MLHFATNVTVYNETITISLSTCLLICAKIVLHVTPNNTQVKNKNMFPKKHFLTDLLKVKIYIDSVFMSIEKSKHFLYNLKPHKTGK